MGLGKWARGGNGAEKGLWAEEKTFLGEMGWGKIHSPRKRWAWGGNESLGMDKWIGRQWVQG